jgi:hypothetical protein
MVRILPDPLNSVIWTLVFVAQFFRKGEMFMFTLTDGKNYVMENPMQQGNYISTTSSALAKKFTYKQARGLLQNKKKSMSWIKVFHMLNCETGEINDDVKYYKGNNGVYVGENNVDFDESIINRVYEEAELIVGLAGWDMEQLKIYREKLYIGLSKYDSAESDIGHALQKYREDKGGKKPQAHKMAKIAYLLDEIRDKRKHIKQCIDYIKVFEEANVRGYTLEKIKSELKRTKHREYKGRTEYYQMVLDLLD